MNAGFSWYPENSYADMKGSGTAASYSQKINRIQHTQDSCAVYYPIINTSILDGEDGVFANKTSNISSDTTLIALVDRGITDVYNYWTPSYSVAYPKDLTFHIVGPQRTWINGKELRFHSVNSISRYFLQGSVNHVDSLKKAYIDMARFKLNRATFQSHLLPRIMGLYVYLDAASTSVRATAAASGRAMARAKFATGVYLPTSSFCGGAKATYAGAAFEYDRAMVDSTRSVFLDVMKMVNNQKKMGDYIVSTYGINGTTPFIFSWLSDVKWDRRNGLAFANNHIIMP